MMEDEQLRDLPSMSLIEQERSRLSYRHRYYKAIRSTIYVLVVVAAVAVLIATLFLPVFQITGTSMEPNMNDGDIVVAVKTTSFQQGQVVGFYFNNKLLLKRVIATQGDWVEIDEDGNVTVNGTLLDEPYVIEKSLGISDIEYPYQVPDNGVFVLGDHRAESVDSRSSLIGCIAADEIVGHVVFKVWPFRDAGLVD
jgi:signal peptidase I